MEHKDLIGQHEDSGLDISYALRTQAIKEQRQSQNASENKFNVGTYRDLIPVQMWY